MNILDEPLVRLAQEKGRQGWAGAHPPLNMEPLDFALSTNFRFAASMHQQFSVVWLFEEPLNKYANGGWKIVLDEAVRLLGAKGCLVLRVRKEYDINVPKVKNYLGRRLGLVCDVEYETDPEGEEDIFVLSVERQNLEVYQPAPWTFGVLTVGNHVDWVCEFLESIRSHDPERKHEIIIVGPENDAYTPYGPRYIDIKQFRDDKFPEVCKKKNAIIDQASNMNLMIVHDRYKLGDDFFEGFEEYGYDFDFLTVKQFDKQHHEFPSYSAQNVKLAYSGQIQVNDYQRLYESQYINGGLLIMKTHIARAVRFNPIVFWGQMEDVELSVELMNHGIIPRMNYLSSAITQLVKPDYLNSWKVVERGSSFLENVQSDDQTLKRLVIKRVAGKLPPWVKDNWLYGFLKRHIRH